jgi:hypothetical protein
LFVQSLARPLKVGSLLGGKRAEALSITHKLDDGIGRTRRSGGR